MTAPSLQLLQLWLWLCSPTCLPLYLMPSHSLNLVSFCRTMLCISAAYAVMWCLSIRLSVTFVCCVRTSNHIFKIFSPSGSHTILVFQCQTFWQFSDGDPLNGASSEKIVIFNQYVALSRMLPDHGSLVTLIAGSTKCLHLLIVGDEQRSAVHEWILFMTGSLYVTLEKTEHNLIVHTAKSEAGWRQT